MKYKEYCKAKMIALYRGIKRCYTAYVTSNLKYSVPKKIPIVFHNVSNCYHDFMVKELPEEFKKQFICLGESTKICKTFTVPIEKEVRRNDKNRKKIIENISYTLQFIDSARIMASSLSNLVNNFFLKEFIE